MHGFSICRRRLTCLLVAGLLAIRPGLAPRADEAPAAAGGVAVAEMTPEAEQAIGRGLDQLAASQHPDGSWGTGHRVASTALTLMAFMVKGQFPDRQPQGEKLAKGLEYLVKQKSNQDGYLGGSMYEHGLATLALSEVWGMNRQEDVGDALKAAVKVILRSQNPQGGWRYQPQPNDADLSVTVMEVVALASAKEAGIVVPDSVIAKAIDYVVSCHDSKSGGFGYQPAQGPGFARTAAGTMALAMCGRRDSDQFRTGLDYLTRAEPAAFENADGHFFYAHYYAAQAMFQAGDQFYGPWYPRIRESLLKKQAADGSWADQHGVGTQVAVLVLGIPYRFLPIYQR